MRSRGSAFDWRLGFASEILSDEAFRAPRSESYSCGGLSNGKRADDNSSDPPRGKAGKLRRYRLQRSESDGDGMWGGGARKEHETTTGWQRAGGLVTLFSPAPFGPRAGLSPDFLYAADPDEKPAAADVGDDSGRKRPKPATVRDHSAAGGGVGNRWPTDEDS